MDSLTETRPVTRLEVVDTGRRRRWSREAKLRIVEESFSAPREVSATARRHGIPNQLLFSWRKAYREGRLGESRFCGFVPAKIIAEQSEKGAEAASGRMEVVTANGRRVIVERDVDLAALLRIIQGLETLR
jgi:transposase